MQTREAGAPAEAVDAAPERAPQPLIRRPLHPFFVLAAAAILPGAGQVLNRMPTRALVMVFFMLSLGFLTLRLAAPERSFVGRHAGGIFVYAVAVLDAYGIARYRWERFRQGARTGGA
ncbi:conserved membrane hypothetical protein [Paraburkholderia ribeironis]|uniref:Uncharacterized protein n=1 Tax=Paraburkholderia ribeironis TaxID=1247936 RepID=A0A1N7S2A1_9BURK|nr:hypothetical protein [Paraburkholderia ribeironis]SIT41488.1 conserved membrane hypothetical protein [Paraburkholderia ribeironis]